MRLLSGRQTQMAPPLTMAKYRDRRSSLRLGPKGRGATILASMSEVNKNSRYRLGIGVASMDREVERIAIRTAVFVLIFILALVGLSLMIKG